MLITCWTASISFFFFFLSLSLHLTLLLFISKQFFLSFNVIKFVRVRVVDDEEYEKNETFFIWLDEPYLVKKPTGSSSGSVVEEDDPVLAELGKPRRGENIKITVHIIESTEFKSVVDKLLKKANLSLVVGTSSWREQFIEAITVNAGQCTNTSFLSLSHQFYFFFFSFLSFSFFFFVLLFSNFFFVFSEAKDEGGGSEEKASKGFATISEGDDDQEEGEEEKLPSCMDYIMHFVCLFWKVLFAFVPPTDYWGGWACFTVSIILIGVLTAFIGDFASHFGCTIGLKDAVTAVSFVALGTSVPDTFASKVAAINDKYADSSIGNVTGSNAVNVFLGIGIAWSIAAIYHAANGTVFRVHPGTLAFSVTIFCVFAFFTIILLVSRRHRAVGGELGGPLKIEYKNSKLGILQSLFIFFLFNFILPLSHQQPLISRLDHFLTTPPTPHLPPLLWFDEHMSRPLLIKHDEVVKLPNCLSFAF
ncbi:SLC8A [Acanthosepion pharaonis]|uniref:SLC8A n=1 Tax=Acanthosepion pharaonis TaxID=158019 RepID=A0A812C4I6_ACAPH|nr:SLC8A [Sepia pharaonis]